MAACSGVETRLKESSVSYLLVGGSGSGKSTFLKRLAKANAQKPLFLVGGNPDDYKELSFQTRELNSSLTEEKNCTVVIDDLFSLRNPAEQEKLRHLLCKTKRHNKVTIGVAVHMLEYTGVRGGLLDHFDVVVFTQTKQEDDRNVQLFLKRLGSVEWIAPETFTSIPQFGYLWVNVQKREALVIDEKGGWSDGCGGADGQAPAPRGAAARAEALARRREGLRRDIGKILKVFPDLHTMANCHLDYILKNLPANQISTTDFTLTLRGRADKDGNSSEQVSLVDYLVACQRPHTKPSKGQKRLKKYLDGLFHTPKALILNAGLR